jgi:hypothetical protein
MFLSGTQDALASGLTVNLVYLVIFEFDNGAQQIAMWTGEGNLVYGGKTYFGVGDKVSVDGMTFGENDEAAKITFTISLVDPAMIALALNPAIIEGYPATLYGLFLDANLQPTDAAFALKSQMVMHAPSFLAQGPSSRQVSMQCETIWTYRNRAKNANYSSTDQQARFPGDLGLEFITSLQHKKVAWPTY